MSGTGAKARFVAFVEQSRWMEGIFWLYLSGFFFSIVLAQIVAGAYFLLALGTLAWFGVRTIDRVGLAILAYVLVGLVGFVLIPTGRLLVQLILITYIPIARWLSLRNGTEMTHWVTGIIVLATVTAVVGVADHFLGAERASGFYGGYFVLVGLLCWSIPLTVARYFSVEGRSQWLYLASILIQTAALWWSYTRSALLGVFIAFGLWGITWLVRTVRQRRPLVSPGLWKWGAVTMILAGVMVLLLTSDTPRLNPLMSVQPGAGEAVDLTSGRSSIIEDAVSIIADEWRAGALVPLIIGHGLSSRVRLVGDAYISWESDYLQAFMDHGLLGLLLVLAMYAAYLRLAARGLRSDDPLLNGLSVAGIVTLVMSFFTLRLTGWHGAGIFVLNYSLLTLGLRDRRGVRASQKNEGSDEGGERSI